MALDWKKEISLSDLLSSFGGGRKRLAGASSYPTKTTMNLSQGETRSTNIRKVGITALVLAVCISLFVKFGVLDQIAALNQKEAELAAQQQIAFALAKESSDYKDVRELFDSYEARLGDAAVDVIAVLDVIEKTVMPKAEVSAIVISDGTLTLTLDDATLQKVGELAKSLEEQELVSSVNVSTATTQNMQGKSTVSTLVITLVGAGSEEK